MTALNGSSSNHLASGPAASSILGSSKQQNTTTTMSNMKGRKSSTASSTSGKNSAVRSFVFLGTNVVIGVTLLANIVAGMFGNIRTVSLSVVRGVSSNFASASNGSSNGNSPTTNSTSNGYKTSSSSLGAAASGDEKRRCIPQPLQHLLSFPLVQVFLATMTLFSFPFLVWMGIPFEDASLFAQAKIGWDALLHISVTPIFFLALARGIIIAYNRQKQALQDGGGGGTSISSASLLMVDSNNRKRSMSDMNITTSPSSEKMSKAQSSKFPPRALSPTRNLIYIGGTAFVVAVITSQLQVISPNWIWNPFLWGMTVYWPKDLATHLQGLCVDDVNHHEHAPLCLNRQAWKVLSAEVLDSDNPRDVATVMEGVRNVRDASYGGLILNVMARDTVDAIPALRQNVEALLPFFQKDKLAVVVFENDSKDGTRQAFQSWARESTAMGYKVDVMECEPQFPNCQYGMSHRYDSTEAKDYFTSSAIGKMSDFRQRMVDYVVSNPYYENFGHMLVMDLDLQVSLSPLGILHTLGTKVAKDHVVASSGRQTWPGGLGTLMPPYDFSAFRMVKTPGNTNMLWLHDQFCALMPPGDRWRNQCDAVSPMQLMLVLGRDQLYRQEPYKVASAFNGATLYPLQLIRDHKDTGRYNAGDDGQRCEHIGFNMGLNDYMYINPKWNFHIAPENPGGPTGFRAYRNVVRIVFTPRLSAVIGPQMAFCMVIFVSCVMTIGMHLAYPLCLCAISAICGWSRHYRQQQLLWRYSNGTSSSLPLVSVAKKGGNSHSSSNNHNNNGPAPAEYWMMSSFLNDLTRRSSSAVMPVSHGDASADGSDSMVESMITVSMTAPQQGGSASLESGSLSDGSTSSSCDHHHAQSSTPSCHKAV